MQKDTPLYNSRITKSYFDYLETHYPGCDIDSILARAGIQRYEVEDPAHWFTQDQVDRLHEIFVQETGNPHISRDVGRATAQSEAMGMAKQYVLGMMTPAAVYLVFGKIAALFTRHMQFKTRKLGPDLIEVIVTMLPGVSEKPYQCEYRLGSLEAVTYPFCSRLAEIEHTECIHRGGRACRYLIRLPGTDHIVWRRVRNIAGLVVLLAVPVVVMAVRRALWLPLALAGGLFIALPAWLAERIEKKGLIRNLKAQGEAAQGQIDAMRIRANHAQLVQEIGAVASSIREENRLIRTILGVMEQRLNFDRAMLLLARESSGVLSYAGGHGYSDEEKRRLEGLRIPLERPAPGQPAFTCLPGRAPALLDTPESMARCLPPALADALDGLGIRNCICAPVLYEHDTLGLLLFQRTSSGRPLTQSDLTLLEGVASHTALSIANARSYRKLEISERNFRELVQGANSIILRCDPLGHLTFINHFALELFGVSGEEVIGRHIAGTILPAEEEIYRLLHRLMASIKDDPQRMGVTETPGRNRDGKEIWIAWTYRPLFDEDGGIREILCIGNDITELRTTRKEKEILASRLERAARMEAVGTLAGGVAHELNNILSGIVSYPELLLMDLPSESPLRKPVGTIQQAGQKAAKIVQDMLLLSRRSVSTTEPLALNSVVRIYLDGSEHRGLTTRHPGVQVKLSLEEDLPPLPGSQEHLIRALQSLVHYGFQAMNEGGALRIETKRTTLTREYVGYEPVKPGDYVLLRVSDEGPTLTWDHLERIFEPFYTKKVLKRPGRGLGLPVVWGIVKDHGGFVDVQSHPDSGTVFTLFLPAATGQTGASAKEETGRTTIMGRGESILVVDDIQEQRVIAEIILKRLNYQPVTLESGEAALAYLKDNEADLVMLDMVMEPGMDGLDTYRGILEIRPGQKAIIVSGYSETGRVREALRLGIRAYLKKPYSVETLGRVVRKELDR